MKDTIRAEVRAPQFWHRTKTSLTVVRVKRQDSLWMRAWTECKNAVQNAEWAKMKASFLEDIDRVMSTKVGIVSVRIRIAPPASTVSLIIEHLLAGQLRDSRGRGPAGADLDED